VEREEVRQFDVPAIMHVYKIWKFKDNSMWSNGAGRHKMVIMGRGHARACYNTLVEICKKKVSTISFWNERWE
jgi:hypothetical protein